MQTEVEATNTILVVVVVCDQAAMQAVWEAPRCDFTHHFRALLAQAHSTVYRAAAGTRKLRKQHARTEHTNKGAPIFV